MESNNELIKNYIKNCTCYYIDDIMRVVGIDFDIFLDEKSYKTYENILIYDILHKI